MNVIHVLSELPTTKEVINLTTAISQPGKKHIFHTKKITPEIKDHYQRAFSNHKHFFHADGEVNTVFDAIDKVGAEKPIRIMSYPSQVSGLQHDVKKTHGGINISVIPLPHDKEKPKTVKDFHPSIKLVDTKKMLGESFEIGDYVTNGEVEGEILHIHTRYATVISEGIEYRMWTKDLEISENHPKRNQLYKESFIYKGYKTKNFNRTISESFKDIANREDDEYAVLECVKVFDYILGINDKNIVENFKTVRIQIERLKRYSKKIGASYLTENFVCAVEEELLKCAIVENLKFSTTDRNMIAKVIAMVAGVSINSIDPTNTINQAAIKIRTEQLTPQGWQLVGRLFNVATNAGIKFNKDTFSTSIQQSMGLI